MSLKDDLKAEASHLGFPLVGITDLSKPAHGNVFTAWLAKNRHAGMKYLQTGRSFQLRLNPAQWMPEAQAVIVLGMPYPSPFLLMEEPAIQTRGRFAAYSWGKDYHKVIPERLEMLVKFLVQATGKTVLFKLSTDSSPILERDLAQRAGLGWIGKNTNLISPGQGSFFFLSELFVDIVFEPDTPFTPDRCGSCQRCIQACPTGCILPDRTIDANRCISYLTIENKRAIPIELRSKLGNWIFGCDLCQMVCPWNIHASRPEVEQEFKSHFWINEALLNQEIHLSNQEFSQKFGNTPVKRALRRGYLRNVAVAIGNSHDPRSVPELIRALVEEREPLVRSHITWALGKYHQNQARSALAARLIQESNPDVITEIRMALDS